jgi:DNA-directed RNA polymerase specialized sigma24 family protein
MNSEIVKNITEIRKNIKNLASRSCTTVEQLLERAEMYPSTVSELDQFITGATDSTVFPDMNAEDEAIRQIMVGRAIDNMKAHLTEDEYNLLYAHFVEGHTVRDLAPKLGIKPASVTVRIHNLINKLKKKEDKILMK